MLRVIILLLAILLPSYAMTLMYKIRFGKTVVISYTFLTLIMLLSSFLGKLSYYKYLLALYLLAVCIYVVYKLINRRSQLIEGLRYFLNPTFFIFIFIFLYLYLNFENVGLSNIDDLGFWGTKLKDMFRTDALYSSDYTVFGISSYPPFTHLLEASFCKILGGYSERGALLALSTFSFSFLLPCLDRFKWKFKDLVNAIICLFTLIFLTLAVQKNPSMANPSFVYNSLYVDWLLAFALAYGFYLIYKFNFNSTIDFISLGVVGIVLCLTKQVGIALFLLLATSFLVFALLSYKAEGNDYPLKRIIGKYVILVIILPLLTYCSWRIFLSFFIESSPINSIVQNATEALIHTESVIDNEKSGIINIFLEALVSTPIFTKPLTLSYVAMIFIIVVFLIVFCMVTKKKANFYSIPIMYLLGSIGYALGILLSYMFIFGHEGTYLVMFGRYMQTYTLAGIALVVLIIIDFKILFVKNLGLLLVTLLIVEPSSIETIIYNPNRVKYREKEITQIESYIKNEYDYQKMIVINQTDMAYLSLFKYTVEEKGKNVTYLQVTEDKSLDWFISLLEENELIFIGDFDNRFLNFWEQLTDLPPYNNSLYKILHGIGKKGIDFELVYTWDE